MGECGESRDELLLTRALEGLGLDQPEKVVAAERREEQHLSGMLLPGQRLSEARKGGADHLTEFRDPVAFIEDEAKESVEPANRAKHPLQHRLPNQPLVV